MYYDHKNVEHARALRKEMTPWERKLWYCFLKAYPVRFQRQRTIGHYIADFFCAQAGLIVELDGSQHYAPDKNQQDTQRTEDLGKYGYRVIRFSNRDVDRNFRGVCETIDHAIQERTLPQSKIEDF